MSRFQATFKTQSSRVRIAVEAEKASEAAAEAHKVITFEASSARLVDLRKLVIDGRLPRWESAPVASKGKNQ